MSELSTNQQKQINSNERDLNLIASQAIFRGYKTRRYFYLFQDKILVKDQDIFVNFPLFKSLFSSEISIKILDYLERSGMYFKSDDLTQEIWTKIPMDSAYHFYYGALDKNEHPHNFGIAITYNSIYEGHLNEGKFQGKGRIIDTENGEYDGDWNLGQKHGNGKMNYWNGNKYVGNWEKDQKCGFGILDEGERHYEGNFRNDMKNGYGEQRYRKDLFKGLFENGLYEGHGRYEYEKFVYQGNYKKGLPHGKGVVITKGWTYEGDFVEGKKSGFGIFEDSYGIFESRWENDRPIGEYVCYTAQVLIKIGNGSMARI